MLKFYACLIWTLSLGLDVLSQGDMVVPTPSRVVQSKGVHVLPDMLQINDENLPEYSKDVLKQWVTKELKKNLLFNAAGNDITFQRLQNVPEDSYTIDILNGIKISYSSDASCFYALQTLFQLVDREAGTVANCFVSDQPKFAWRGMHLDVSRHFYTVDEIKRYLDLMAHYKFNTFHWHLTDDQGWRIEIRKYPKLTQIGSVRAQSLVGHASNIPEVFDGVKEEGFYSQNDIREIVAYANKRYINVVPEIEMPGHASAAIAAYPELNCLDTTVKVVEKWGVFEDVFCTKPQTMQFLKDVLEEVCQLFPSEYVHIGGDEVPKAHWEKCGNCQKTMVDHRLKNTHELQSYFIREMDVFLTSRGKKLIGWDEILEGGLSENATVMSWRGTSGGIEAARKEHFVVMSPTSHCYFDHYQGESAKEPLAIGGYLPLEKVFHFNPIPDALEPYQANYILGAQANLWTEYIANVEHLDYMIFPRLLALSEVVWSTNKCDYEQFIVKLENKQLPFLDEKGVNYSTAHRRTKTEVVEKNGQIKIVAKASNPNWTVEISSKGKPSMAGTGSSFYDLKPTNFPMKELYRVETKDGETVVGVDTVVINNQPFLGKKWTISPEPSEHYSGKGAVSLTDGIIGSRPWNGKEWLGFQTDTITFTYDYGQDGRHNTIELNLLEASSSWIYLPKKIRCTYYKANGKKRGSVEIQAYAERIGFVQKKAKYAKVEIQVIMDDKIPAGQPGEGQKPWFFISEIITLP